MIVMKEWLQNTLLVILMSVEWKNNCCLCVLVCTCSDYCKKCDRISVFSGWFHWNGTQLPFQMQMYWTACHCHLVCFTGSCCHCTNWPGFPLHRHLQSPPGWSSSSLTTEFTLTCASSDKQKYCGHSDSTFIHWAVVDTGTGQKQQRDGLRGISEECGKKEVKKEEWVWRERRREKEKWQQIEASNTKWEGVCWPGHRKKKKIPVVLFPFYNENHEWWATRRPVCLSWGMDRRGRAVSTLPPIGEKWNIMRTLWLRLWRLQTITKNCDIVKILTWCEMCVLYPWAGTRLVKAFCLSVQHWFSLTAPSPCHCMRQPIKWAHFYSKLSERAN